MIQCAIVYEDDKPVRLFKDSNFLNSAYRWAHKHYCLEDVEPSLKLWELPEWLTIKYHFLTEEQINNLIK